MYLTQSHCCQVGSHLEFPTTVDSKELTISNDYDSMNQKSYLLDHILGPMPILLLSKMGFSLKTNYYLTHHCGHDIGNRNLSQIPNYSMFIKDVRDDSSGCIGILVVPLHRYHRRSRIPSHWHTTTSNRCTSNVSILTFFPGLCQQTSRGWIPGKRWQNHVPQLPAAGSYTARLSWVKES